MNISTIEYIATLMFILCRYAGRTCSEKHL